MLNADPTRSGDSGDSSTRSAPQGGAGFRIDAHSVIRHGERWFPVSGEYHFSRDTPGRWERELRKMKAGGITLVATYLIWILHEEQRGRRRWDGHLDVRRFVETAHAVGLDVVMRIGPWAHGEARNGGFPDWLQSLPLAHRTNDQAYLDLVADWYADVSSQLTGLFRDDAHPDAPIVAIQVDNELYDQPEHLATLRDIAEDVGMTAPFWVATGWGGAHVPLDTLIPVYAGYSDGFWEESDVEVPAFAKLHFEFSNVRDDLSVGADVRDSGPTFGVDDRRYPFLTCELGAGMAVAYHRRPHVDPDDVGALALTKLGSGSAWQGYYVYHGTVQPTGELTSLQESHDSGYPNELPTKDYDFYAPIGSAGVLRPHYHRLRTQHLLVQQWGADLLELPADFPDAEVNGLRTAVRIAEGKGYLFGNNHQPAFASLDPVPAYQLRYNAEGRDRLLPGSPVTIPAGAYFIWPIRQSYGEVLALTGTIQPITQIETVEGIVVLFGASNSIPIELDVQTSGAPILGADPIETADGVRWVPTLPPGPDCVITVGTTRLVILDEVSRDAVWKGDVGDKQVVVIWNGGLTFEDDRFVIERGASTGQLLTIPPATGATEKIGEFHRVPLPVAADARPAAIRELSRATGSAATIRGGTMDRYSAPRPEDFSKASVFEIDVQFDPDFDGAQVLTLNWRGDVARAYVGGELVSDQFWHGRPWELDLTQLPGLEARPLRVEILPWNGDADFHVDRRVRAQRVAGLAEISAAELVKAARVPITFPRAT